MRPREPMRHAVAAAALLATTAAVAQQPSASGTQEWYAVEVVIADQRNAALDDGERWPRNPPLPSVSHPLVRLDDPARPGPAFSRLAPGARALDGVRQRIDGKTGYEVLAHLAWRQPGLDRAEAPAVVLPVGWDPPARPTTVDDGAVDAPDTPAPDGPAEAEMAVDDAGSTPANPFARVPPDTRLFGTVRAYRSRYLHVELDLRFAPGGVAASRMSLPEPAVPADGPAPAYEAATGTRGIVYPMIQERRLRGDALHYLDHPALAVIVSIRPMDPPPGADTPAESDASPESAESSGVTDGE